MVAMIIIISIIIIILMVSVVGLQNQFAVFVTIKTIRKLPIWNSSFLLLELFFAPF